MADNIAQPYLMDLPEHLAERIRLLNQRSVASNPPNGEFVLYWMHHAVRGHENPALDTALWVADQLQLPTLVYQGLGGRHPYNNDRHHTFILQGARDVEIELNSRGISYAFHLAESSDGATPLRRLVSRAVLTVTEDFPAPPFKQWIQRMAVIAPAAFWAVDTACIVPMQSLRRPYDRAFLFRRDTHDAFAKRIAQPYPPLGAAIRPFGGNLGFQPLHLASADIADCCASCRIDHSVGPVAHTQGGAKAGYHRWGQFKQYGLTDYDKTRNDPAIAFPSGVSRMSAYLHHGHVSPFRIVREAAQYDNQGASKYLDEILIWRELGHNFCYHHNHPGCFDAIPPWSQVTLNAHLSDRRHSEFTWEELSRARSGDPLWDAAQQSLLIHGELHNNVRMTWGKAVLHWVRTPQEALRMMIDLNHRFALDGSDPNSYAGILWCLGLFDRPFKPPQPVIGTLRPRSLRTHAARMDMVRYATRVRRPASGAPHQVAVIGAGISGLVAARTLADHGHRVHVFEKARGMGGRLTTRRTTHGDFDHGAQYFTIRDERARRWMESWRQAGLVRRWQGRIGVLHQGTFTPGSQSIDRFVGVPGMSTLANHLANDVTIEVDTRIGTIQRSGAMTTLIDSSGVHRGDFDVLVITAPPEQAIRLTRHLTPMVNRLHAVRMTPCWAVLLAFDEPLTIALDGAFVKDSALSWVARNSSKPGRGPTDCWVLHASADWSASHFDVTPHTVISHLSESFSTAMGEPLPPSVFSAAHRWQYAQAQQPLRAGCLWDRQSKIGFCGDWCYGSRIEGAFLSGAAMAGRILST